MVINRVYKHNIQINRRIEKKERKKEQSCRFKHANQEKEKKKKKTKQTWLGQVSVTQLATVRSYVEQLIDEQIGQG